MIFANFYLLHMVNIYGEFFILLLYVAREKILEDIFFSYIDQNQWSSSYRLEAYLCFQF